VAAAWGLELAPQVLRLDPALPLGHERDLGLLANTLPPEKHRGYALQWFGLSAATLVILIVLSLRRRR
jgi:cytochrome oxidase assembly protein ShyY1